MNSTSPISIRKIKAVVESRFAPQLITGIDTHDAGRGFVAQIVKWSQDANEITDLVRALLPANYRGNTLDEVPALVAGALKKGFQQRSGEQLSYIPGEEGPIPLGYTRDGQYAVLDQIRNIIVSCSANQLLSPQHLVGLAPSAFWGRQFPSDKGGFQPFAAGEALIKACREAGPFDPRRVRGRGVWLEGDTVIKNLGEKVPETAQYRYLCFDPIPLKDTDQFESERLLEFLSLFNWRNPQDAQLLFGWLAIAPICGALKWRPHCFLYGPARCGKTTIHILAGQILDPLVIATDGQSSEAGIRQTLGADSLPIIIDEFESDQNIGGLKGVIRLARSASSAENAVLRGTPEGRAMQFSLRATFFFSAINPTSMSAADESRIMLFELLMHENDPKTSEKILAEETFFRDRGPSWCGYMASLAHHIPKAIDLIELCLPSVDRRHRQNMATLLAGTFVALKKRIPTQDEAREIAVEYAETTEIHAEALDRDDAEECLAYLYAHPIERYTLGHWVATAYRSEEIENPCQADDAARITRMYDIILRADAEPSGFVLRNGSPAIEKVFTNTRWEGFAWMRALRKLEGASAMKAPVWFPNTSRKHRCLLLPLEYIPEPIPTADKDDVDY